MSDHNGTQNSPDKLIRDFKLPAMVPIEDLMSKYSGTLEITIGVMSGVFDKIIRDTTNNTNGQHEKRHQHSVTDVSKDCETLTPISNNSTTNNNNNQSRESDNDGNDQSDCVILSSNINEFKTPSRNVKRTKRRQTTEKTPNASTTSANSATITTSTNAAAAVTPASRSSRRKKGAPPVDNEAKPGTLGSRQSITTQSRENKEYLNVQCNDLIDTKNLVTSDLVVSLQELCQRAKMKKIPDDPTDLLMKFSLIIPRLSEIDAFIEK